MELLLDLRQYLLPLDGRETLSGTENVAIEHQDLNRPGHASSHQAQDLSGDVSPAGQHCSDWATLGTVLLDSLVTLLECVNLCV